ncbi:MAG: signal peptidase II [Lachnospiraceae bacterium]|nr:signal peptidase II [Lachnospiraceae bacterium]
MKNEKKRQILFAVFCALLLIALDLLTKTAARSALSGGPIELIPGVFELHYLENHGAAFGILQNQRLFFIVITAVFLAAAVFFYAKLPTDRRFLPLRVITVFIAAGAVGNFVDRMLFSYVRDFLYFKLIDFPIFNVADIYVTCGAIAFFIFTVFFYKDDDFNFIKKKKD